MTLVKPIPTIVIATTVDAGAVFDVNVQDFQTKLPDDQTGFNETLSKAWLTSPAGATAAHAIVLGVDPAAYPQWSWTLGAGVWTAQGLWIARLFLVLTTGTAEWATREWHIDVLEVQEPA